jgi:glycine/D-amino acid oxidase-like deaminating enzyme/nitrite reductase/ring-hydroxylating ferredoxin subunit
MKVEVSNSSGQLTSGENISFWIDSVKPLEFGTISQNVSTDVLVIGAGIAGLTTAYSLLKAGKQVVVVEDGFVGSGETGRTTAHLTCALDDRYYEIEKAFGKDGSRNAAESHQAAINRIEEIVNEEKIDCFFERVDGYLFLHPSDKLENLQKEFEATKNAGLNTEWLDNIPGITSANGPCIRFPNQGQFHIMRYLHGLANAVIRMGGNIFTKTHATSIKKTGAVCNGYVVSANNIVVATNTPVNDLVTMHTKQFPYRTYVIGAKILKGKLQHSLWWDTGDLDSKWISDPYHYIRLVNFNDEYDLLISGGEDHKTGQADDENIPEQERYTRLIEWTMIHFPMIEEIIYHWSGQVLEPVDYMAFIGKNPGDDNIFIITGDSGNGMTHGTIGGILITDLIMGVDNPWTDLYSPKRIPIKTPGTYLSEVLNMAAQYGDYLKKGDIKGLEELKAGEGAILSHGLKKIAVYRDGNGIVNSFSAVCPHLGCIIQWNAEEKSFDCPCHGSRFTKEGVVINGPATKGLHRVQVKE